MMKKIIKKKISIVKLIFVLGKYLSFKIFFLVVFVILWIF